MKLVVVVVILAFLGYHEAALPPPQHAAVDDTQGMAKLVSTFLLHIKGSLFVYGRSRALDALLAQLHPEVPRSIVPPPATDFYGAIRRVLELQRRDNVVLVADDAARGLALANSLIADVGLPNLTRLLVWTWAEGRQAATVPPNITHTLRLFGIETTLAVSTADGATVLYRITLRQRAPHVMVVTEVDAWSPSSRRWRRGALPFTRTCSKWRPNHRGSKQQPLNLYASQLGSHMTDQFQATYLDFVTRMTKSLPHPMRVRWVEGYKDWWGELSNCSLSVLFS
ncbi:Ionotropic receptor 125, partial [Frankliniella occidentalis]